MEKNFQQQFSGLFFPNLEKSCQKKTYAGQSVSRSSWRASSHILVRGSRTPSSTLSPSSSPAFPTSVSFVAFCVPPGNVSGVLSCLSPPTFSMRRTMYDVQRAAQLAWIAYPRMTSINLQGVTCDGLLRAAPPSPSPPTDVSHPTSRRMPSRISARRIRSRGLR